MEQIINQCLAMNISGKQCLRNRNKSSEYCGTHEKTLLPVDITTSVKTEIEICEVRGIPYYVNKLNRVYQHETIFTSNPMVIGEYQREANTIQWNSKPSIPFCKTGILGDDEVYHQDLHSCSGSLRIRASGFYSEAEILQMEQELENEKASRV